MDMFSIHSPNTMGKMTPLIETLCLVAPEVGVVFWKNQWFEILPNRLTNRFDVLADGAVADAKTNGYTGQAVTLGQESGNRTQCREDVFNIIAPFSTL